MWRLEEMQNKESMSNFLPSVIYIFDSKIVQKLKFEYKLENLIYVE